MKFLQKRWVRIIGLVPMTLYTALAVYGAVGVIRETLFRPPNHVFPGTDLIGIIGLFIFLGIVAGSGVLAVFTAYFMKGIYKILYYAGGLALASAIVFLPLSLIFNAEVDFHPRISGPEFVVGTWMDTHNRLDLRADSTYTFAYIDVSDPPDGKSKHSGTWSLDRHLLCLTPASPDTSMEWRVRESDGYYFITYEIPPNPDAWSGNLGMMRETEWLERR